PPPAAPQIDATDSSVVEGDDGTHAAHVLVRLSAPAPAPAGVAVDYATADPLSGAAATPGVDYAPAGGTLHFPPGQSSATIDVPIIGDRLHEDDETLAVVLSNADGG